MADPQRIYELMILTAWADGKVEPAEALAIHDLAASHLGAMGNRSEIARTVKERVERQGIDAALREIASAVTDRADQELAFRCCARVLGADGEMPAEEVEVLATLQELFALSPADVKRLLASPR